jgi:hypothetical protein
MNLSERQGGQGWAAHPGAGGDHPKPQDGAGVSAGWSTGQPQFTFYRVGEKKESGENTHHYIENFRIGVDRLTTPGYTPLTSLGFGWSPHLSRGLTTPDHPREVTL